MSELTKLSLFSGILGDDSASEWAGIKTICCVEIDKFCQAVIKKHYPDMPIIGDIHDVTKAKLKEVSGYEYIDIVAGGDPCQPRSIAGKRRGREDDRDLWPEMFRVICEFKPAWVVNENPTGRLTMDFHEVLSDLESQGYETRSFVIPACAVNAWHRRDRLFIVAHSNNRHKANAKKAVCTGWSIADLYTSSNPNESRYQSQFRKVRRMGRSVDAPKNEGIPNVYHGRTYWEAEPELGRVVYGLSPKLDKLRCLRLDHLGNSCVPQQVYPIYKAIVEVERQLELCQS